MQIRAERERCEGIAWEVPAERSVPRGGRRGTRASRTAGAGATRGRRPLPAGGWETVLLRETSAGETQPGLCPCPSRLRGARGQVGSPRRSE